MKKLVCLVALFSVLGLFAPQVAQTQFGFLFRHPLEGKYAPDFTLDTLNNRNVNFTEFRDGQPAILFFWTTWCPHCRRELKELSARKVELNQKEIKLILIDLEESPAQVKSYFKRSDIYFDVFMDTKAVVAENYRIMGVPSYFFVDSTGKVKAVEHVFLEDYEVVLLGEK